MRKYCIYVYLSVYAKTIGEIKWKWAKIQSWVN